jgi:hypothetical protein
VLDPNFAIANINVNNTAMDSLAILPTNGHQLVMITFAIDNLFNFYLAIARAVLSIFVENIANITSLLN